MWYSGSIVMTGPDLAFKRLETSLAFWSPGLSCKKLEFPLEKTNGEVLRFDEKKAPANPRLLVIHAYTPGI